MNKYLPETLGQYLRRERESREVSLEEISRGTRISRPYLQALEKDDFKSITQQEFILGFLKGYARYLGLDTEEVLKRYRFQRELASRKEVFQQLPLFPSSSVPAEETKEPTISERCRQRFQGRKGFPLSIIVQVIIILIAISLGIYIRYILK